MGIPYFESQDLPTILELLDLQWSATEKLDGSYMEFGLDKDGKFFTRRKGGELCYSLNDWPLEGWTNSFRAAHDAAEEVADYLVERGILWPRTRIYCEVLVGDRPNTIPYENEATLVISGWSHSADTAVLSFALKNFHTTQIHQIFKSYDAKTKYLADLPLAWRIIVLEPISMPYIHARLYSRARNLKEQLVSWSKEVIGDTKMTRSDLLSLPLNRCPIWIPKNEYPAVKTVVKQIRAEWQSDILPLLTDFRNTVLHALLYDQYHNLRGSRFSEGLVIRSWAGTIIKFVDREGFSKANLHSHRVKYYLVGGRRPIKPCFLSRTKDWPLDKRLARLDVLKERYFRHRHKLSNNFQLGCRLMPVTYENELHERTKLLFADVRERITNGR